MAEKPLISYRDPITGGFIGFPAFKGDTGAKGDKGGKAGDQTGRELSTQNWYLHKKGWVVLRPKSPEAAKKVAKAMRAACANRNIGYDQYQRLTLYNVAKPLGFDPGKVVTACETDCSAPKWTR